jgi:hypothetical protein
MKQIIDIITLLHERKDEINIILKTDISEPERASLLKEARIIFTMLSSLRKSK